jgi:hypothetical protein
LGHLLIGVTPKAVEEGSSGGGSAADPDFKDATLCGVHEGSFEVTAAHAEPTIVRVTVTVDCDGVDDGEYADLWGLQRMAWLDR